MINKKDIETAVIILNYNGWIDTIECLESLELYTVGLLVIVVDNKSEDDSLKNIEEWINFPKKKNSYNLIKNSENSGFAAGNNKGINYALASDVAYIWLLNNDTVIDKETYSALLQKCKNNRNLCICGSVIKYYNRSEIVQSFGGGTLLFFRASTSFCKNEDDRLDYIMGASLFVPAEIIKSAGMLDERYFMYWEDVAFSYRVKSAGYNLVTANGSIIYHKESASIKRSIRDNMFMEIHGLKGLILFFRENYPHIWIIPAFSGLIQKLFRRLISFRGNGCFQLLKICTTTIRSL